MSSAPGIIGGSIVVVFSLVSDGPRRNWFIARRSVCRPPLGCDLDGERRCKGYAGKGICDVRYCTAIAGGKRSRIERT